MKTPTLLVATVGAAVLARSGEPGVQFIALYTPDSDLSKSTWPRGLSGDGSIATGGGTGHSSGVRWTNGTAESLPPVNPPLFPENGGFVPWTVSHDGTVILGVIGLPGGYMLPAWLVGGTYVYSAHVGLAPIAIDRAGTTGYMQGAGTDAGSGSTLSMGDQLTPISVCGVPGGSNYTPGDMSDDATVFVGVAGSNGCSGWPAGSSLVWTAFEGSQLLSLPAMHQVSAIRVSPDGHAVMASCFKQDAEKDKLIRWTRVSSSWAMVVACEADHTTHVYDLSALGRVAIGETEVSNIKQAFIWDSSRGMRLIRDVLADGGVDVTGWSLYSARRVSGDGRVVLGAGIDPEGRERAWIVQFDRSYAPYCPGDADGNFDVDFDDLNLVLAGWGKSFGQVGYFESADFDASLTIDFADLNVLLSAWGEVCPTP